MSERRRDERGAVAVMFAMVTVLLFSVAAMGVDLGNAMNRKKQTQTSADFGALAGAGGLPTTGPTTVQAVADYLNQNQPQSDGAKDCNPDAEKTITTVMLTDGIEVNGEVTFPSNTRIHVLAPAARVKFGLANGMGIDDACVQGEATARIASGSVGMAPYYTTPSCSSGPQTIKDNSGGLSIPYEVPPLYPPAEGDDNSSTLLSVNPTQINLAAVGDPDGPLVTLTGTNLNAATIDRVGFFNSDQTAPHIAVPVNQTATTVAVNVPNAVASFQDVWYLRVRDASTGKWSKRLEAQPLLVGASVLSCDVGIGSGNFGSIDVPWGGNDLQDLEKNIADGLRPPTTLKAFPTPLPADNACNTDTRGVTSTDALSKENTNCVQTVTGLKANPAYDGYLDTGGKLRVDTTQVCIDQGRPTRDTLSTGEDVNDDVLSCFLKNDTLSLADTIGYTGAASLFVQDIWKSPRLLFVPVIDHDPNGTKWMPIVRFVPGFITDQPTGARRLSPLLGTQTENGLVVQNPKKLRAIRVFFFSMEALPPPPDGVPLQDYLGSGKAVITLVN